MSKIIRTRKPSVLPFYAMALVFLVLCAVLPVYKLWALLAALGGAFVAFGAAQEGLPAPGGGARSAFPHRCGGCGRDADRHSAETGYPAHPQRAAAGPAALCRHDPHGKGGPLHCGSGGSKPGKGKAGAQVRKLLPAGCGERSAAVCKAGKAGVRGENAAAIRTEVEHNAASIATAFENQLDALYAAESMDLSADITVLQNMLKGQGLS